MANLDSVFIKDQGAIIFPGEKYGLHNQVYINSQGHPTYEGKELGLTQREEELFPFDVSLHVVDSQQTDFFKGVNKALELIEKRDKSKKKHLPYGFVSLSTGRMSSRKGNIISAEDLITQVSAGIEANFPTKLPPETLEKIAVAAIKFFYLKYGLTSDIVYDVEKSVALHGDTGPYVLYVYARIHSLLNRAKGSELEKDIEPDQEREIAQDVEEAIPEDLAPITVETPSELEESERELLRQMEYFTLIIKMAATELQPSLITVYLLGLAKAFNQFYEKCPIFGGGKTEFRLALAKATGERIKLGLYLLGIETVEKM
jgi:arginyl-tRNA synthetase